jgi:3D (Asp-Asp-Asp) domain-containing protein
VLISRSIWRKLAATLVVVVGFVLLYEAQVLDSKYAIHLPFAHRAAVDPLPAAGAKLQFSATAYCKGTTTASGVNVRSGIAAADPDLLPVGSVIQVDAPGARNDGIYTIMDTGPKVQGRRLDLYMWSCHEALAFGRNGVKVTVLRLGWNPQASTPSIVDRLFRRREAAAREQGRDELPPGVQPQVPPSTLPDPAAPNEPAQVVPEASSKPAVPAAPELPAQ